MANKKKAAQDVQEVQDKEQHAASIIAENKTTEDIRNNIDTFKGLIYAMMLFTTRDIKDAPAELQQMLTDTQTADFFRWINKVAEDTGADPLDIISKPTQEQQKAVEDIAMEEIQARYEAAHNSNYTQAINDLLTVKITADKNNTGAAVRQFAALYFFALHSPELLPIRPRELTAEHLQELRDILTRLDQFIADKEETDLDALFSAFIEEAGADPEKMLKALPQVTAQIVNKLEYPIDKINSNIWDALDDAAKDDNGQLHFSTEMRGSKEEATIICAVDFSAMEDQGDIRITKNLTPFDKLVYIAVAATYNNAEVVTVDGQRYRVMSVSQIYRAMGYVSKPNENTIQRINDSLTKMGCARVFLDNSQEVLVNKGYAKTVDDENLLIFRRRSIYINGLLCAGAICIPDGNEPCLIRFAKQRNQITTVTRNVLESPLNKTDSNIRIQDYLIERIARMKSGDKKTRKKINYDNVYTRCQIKTAMQRSRVPKTIDKYLDYWKGIGWIKGYSKQTDGRTIKV